MRTTFLIQYASWMVVMLCLPACGGRHGQPPSLPPSETKTAETSPSVDVKQVPPRYEVTDTVVIETSLGKMTFELYGKQAPKTVANFMQYADKDYFNGKIFHRIIDGFMIQGGGFDASFERGETDPPIALELIPGLKHTKGVISMARQPSDIHSATSQFFICVTDAPQLNGAYAAFGKMISGDETLSAISRVATHSIETDYGKMNDVPIQPVAIESITRL